jgi:hypothetical protein
MAKNLGREYATMDEDERRRFAMTAEDGTDAAPAELDFENPRVEPGGLGEDRDGTSALLDDEAHRRAIAEQRKGAADRRESGEP